jgi:hypothetical protein
MRPFSLKENVVYSYKTYFRFLWKTFLASRGTPGRLSGKRFGVMLVFSLLLLVVQTIHWLAFAVDEVLYRGYKSVAVRQPLFIVGVPRSATTFLHRLLSHDSDRFTTFTLWELLLAPSVTERKLVLAVAALDRKAGGPLRRGINWIEGRVFGHLNDIHRISLTAPEEDYFTLIPIYACFLLILPFPFPEYLNHLAFFDAATPQRDKERIMAFYKTCLQRHLYVHGAGKQLLSKNVSFSPMIETLAYTFPDCRFIGTVRHPVRAIPSHISSMKAGATLFGNDVGDPLFRDQMIDLQRYAYTRLITILPRISANRQMVVRMEDLVGDLYSVVRGIYDRFGFDMTPAYEVFLRREDRRQKTYQSGHTYDLASFDLSHQEIFNRFVDIYQRFHYPFPAPSVNRSR